MSKRGLQILSGVVVGVIPVVTGIVGMQHRSSGLARSMLLCSEPKKVPISDRAEQKLSAEPRRRLLDVQAQKSVPQVLIL